jgi:hypothetical protein
MMTAFWIVDDHVPAVTVPTVTMLDDPATGEYAVSDPPDAAAA